MGRRALYEHNFVRLNDGRLMAIFSDNTEEKTMNLFPAVETLDFDAEWISADEFDYADIMKVDHEEAAEELWEWEKGDEND